jgi:hypothetical protein
MTLCESKFLAELSSWSPPPDAHRPSGAQETDRQVRQGRRQIDERPAPGQVRAELSGKQDGNPHQSWNWRRAVF